MAVRPIHSRFAAAFCLLLALGSAPAAGWENLYPGLRLERFEVGVAEGRTLPVTVLEISPERCGIRLLAASETGTQPMTVQEWCVTHGLAAAINAGMYLEDGITNTGYMRNFGHVNNSTVNKQFGVFLAFNPVREDLPPVRMFDRYSEDWEEGIDGYNTVIQGYRLLDSEGNNLWKPNGERYSVAAVGMTADGGFLFIFSGEPATVYEVNEALLKLPLDITRTMYVEGGTAAAMCLNVDDTRLWLGRNNGTAALPRAVPNVIGIVTR